MHCSPLSWWKSDMGDVAPVGHALRQYMRSNWIRFHSLPGSKRYPESELEVHEVISRHCQIASELFVPGEQLYAYQSRYPLSRRETNARQSIAGRQLREASLEFPVNPETVAREDDDVLVTRALVTTWKPDFYDRLVQEIAHDLEYMVTLVSPASKNVYCPYDGGMDVFVFSRGVPELEAKFSAWLSDRPDRL